jgi:hypothetical protein
MILDTGSYITVRNCIIKGSRLSLAFVPNLKFPKDIGSVESQGAFIFLIQPYRILLDQCHIQSTCTKDYTMNLYSNQHVDVTLPKFPLFWEELFFDPSYTAASSNSWLDLVSCTFSGFENLITL